MPHDRPPNGDITCPTVMRSSSTGDIQERVIVLRSLQMAS